MPKLKPHDQIPVTKDSLARILNAYDIADFTFQPISGGIENTSCVVRSAGKEYVLRIYAQRGKHDADIMLEIRFQDYLREHGIPIPLIYLNKEGKELTLSEIDGKAWQCVLMEFVEGESVTERPPESLIAELGRLQARMHILGMEFAQTEGVPQEPRTELYDTLTSRIADIPVKGKDVPEFIERVKAYRYRFAQDLPSGYCHTDIDFDGNVITKGEKIAGVIDFDDLEYVPLVMCLGYSLWNLMDDEGIDAMHGYLEEYEKVRPLSSREREALPHVILWRNYEVGIIRLLLWDETTPEEDITRILELEKEIPGIIL